MTPAINAPTTAPSVLATKSLREATRAGRNCCENSIAKLSKAPISVGIAMAPSSEPRWRHQRASISPSGM